MLRQLRLAPCLLSRSSSDCCARLSPRPPAAQQQAAPCSSDGDDTESSAAAAADGSRRRRYRRSSRHSTGSLETSTLQEQAQPAPAAGVQGSSISSREPQLGLMLLQQPKGAWQQPPLGSLLLQRAQPAARPQPQQHHACSDAAYDDGRPAGHLAQRASRRQVPEALTDGVDGKPMPQSRRYTAPTQLQLQQGAAGAAAATAAAAASQPDASPLPPPLADGWQHVHTVPGSVVAAGAVLLAPQQSSGRSSSSRQSSSDMSSRPSSSSSVSDSGADDWQEGSEELLEQLQELLCEQGIELPVPTYGQQRTVCPQCGGGSSAEDCFSVCLLESGAAVWCCHRASCGHTGSVRARRSTGGGGGGRGVTSSIAAAALQLAQERPYVPPDTSKLEPLTPELRAWFAARGISAATLARNGVACEWRYCPPLKAVVPHIAFPYRRAGEVVNIKYRALPKHFSQSKGGQQVFWGCDDVQGAEQAIIIVEGELDKLAVEEATGRTAVLSVPAGVAAPPTQAQRQQQWSRKLAFVGKAQGLLAGRRIVIALDGDAAGWHSACELARRLGPARCELLAWPACETGGDAALRCVAAAAFASGLRLDVGAAGGCKDANDVLMACGAEALALFLRHAPRPACELMAADVLG